MITKELKSHLLNMYLIAMSDMDFDEKEMNSIIQIIKDKGISEKEFEEIIINPTNINFSIPTDIFTKFEYLYDYSRIILADGKIEDSEKISLRNFCIKFGFEKEASEELVEWLLEKAKSNLNTESLHLEIKQLIKN